MYADVTLFWENGCFFVASPELKPFYDAYVKAANPRMLNSFRGQCLNSAILVMLFYLEKPHRYGNTTLTPIYRAFSIWRRLFIRKFIGLRDHGKYDTKPLKALPVITFLFSSYKYSLKNVHSLADGLADKVLVRCMNPMRGNKNSLQYHFRRQLLNNEDSDLYDFGFKCIHEGKLYNTKRWPERMKREALEDQ